MADEGHATTTGVLLNDLARGSLGADKHDLILIFRQPLHGTQRVVKRGHSVLKVDDVDLVARPENVLIHFGVPEPGLVSEVRTCLQQVAHTYLRHNQTLCLGYSSAPSCDSNRKSAPGSATARGRAICLIWPAGISQRRALYHSRGRSKSVAPIGIRVGYTLALFDLLSL